MIDKWLTKEFKEQFKEADIDKIPLVRCWRIHSNPFI